MKKDKLYLNRKIDQWRGKPLYVEDEIDKYGYYVYLPDSRIKRGSVTVVFAEFRDKNNATYGVNCEVVDYDDKLVKFMIPTEILSNDGKYELVISVSYNSQGTDDELDRSAIQTFTIVDTIEADDEQIKQDTNYPLLLELINEISQYQVDTSNFPTYEDLEQAINDKLEETSMENIVKELNARGYITNEMLTRILSNYPSYSDLTMYAKTSDLNAYVKYTEYYVTRDKVSDLQTSLTNLRNSLNNYVLKEEGKGLSTHDLTDELYMKLISGSTGGSGEISDELLQMIMNALPRDEANEKYYNREEINALLDDIEIIIEGLDERYIQKTENIITDKIIYKNKSLTDVLDNIYDYPKIASFTIDNDKYIYNIGTESIINPTFKWEIEGNASKFILKGLTSTDIIIYNTDNYTYNGTINNTKEITLIAIDLSNENGDEITYGIDTAKLTLNFVFPFYYGATSYDVLDATTVSVANSSLVLKGTHTFNITANDARPYIIYFTDYGTLKDIKDENGLSYKDCFIEQEVNVSGTIYRGYILDNKVICTDIKFTIYFEDGD